MNPEKTNLKFNFETMKGVFDFINSVLNESEENQKFLLDELEKDSNSKAPIIKKVIEKNNEFQKTSKKPLLPEEREAYVKKYLTASSKIDIARIFVMRLATGDIPFYDPLNTNREDLSITLLKLCFPINPYVYLYSNVKVQSEMCLFERGDEDWQDVLDLVKELLRSDGTVEKVMQIFASSIGKIFD